MARNLRQPVRRGVSMLELMIVVAVLGIIGAMAVPMFSATDATRLTSAASVLAADIDAARAESIAHSDDLRLLVFDEDDVSWHIAAASDTTTPINHPETGLPYSRTLGTGALKQLQGVTIDSYDLDSASETDDHKLGFGIYGQTDQTANPTITLRSGVNVLTLTINATTGEVTIGQVN
ncbi:MAG: Tfp pilus assembly protein FimT/FimU [Phycisphaeraceae bacterium]